MIPDNWSHLASNVETSRRNYLRSIGVIASVWFPGCSSIDPESIHRPSATPVPVPPTPQTTVLVGPDEDFRFEPAEVKIPVGTIVTWVWKSNTHNLKVINKPDESTWDGHSDIKDEGFTHQHQFLVSGRYDYTCGPHEDLGVEGSIIVRRG